MKSNWNLASNRASAPAARMTAEHSRIVEPIQSAIARSRKILKNRLPSQSPRTFNLSTIEAHLRYAAAP